MGPVPLVLASRSTERLRLLRQAGVEPIVRASVVDEDVEREGLQEPGEVALHLAERKALAVAATTAGGLVLGADSVLSVEGEILDKARDADEVLAFWHTFGGGDVVVATGHCLVRATDGATVSGVAVGRAKVLLPTAEELRAYAVQPEVLGAAGAFIVEGLAAPFVQEVSGDAGAISGLSMHVVRDLLARLDLDMTSIWSSGGSSAEG